VQQRGKLNSVSISMVDRRPRKTRTDAGRKEHSDLKLGKHYHDVHYKTVCIGMRSERLPYLYGFVSAACRQIHVIWAKSDAIDCV
jgi:hypothetical protein